MRSAFVVVALIGCLATPALAQNMPVSTFLAKTDGLKAKGMMAILSSDIGLLQQELQAAGLAARTERKAREASGKPKLACPPEKIRMNSDELLASFRAIPAEQRSRVSVKEAMVDFVRKRYPCPK